MVQNRWVWFVAILVLGIVGAACSKSAEEEPVVCDYGGQTAVTANILNENGQPQRLVEVRYQQDDGPWQGFPEHVNAQAVIQGGPGSYRIRAEKPGYTAAETTLDVTETAVGSCLVAEQTISLPMSLAVCPATEPALLEIEVEPAGSDLVVTAVSSKGGSQTVSCAQPGSQECARYTLPLEQIADYTVQ
ncbi:MAG: hypothetical protein KC449_22990, partial [Anaerolineales bacterium]|nr:hypothetical protein [Anaerolineales bacterium]